MKCVSDKKSSVGLGNVADFLLSLLPTITVAFKEGRGGKDPKEFWYQGELGFYDFYIIPLAERLKECPAFYTSGRELLLYAISNRKEWETKGMEVLENL